MWCIVTFESSQARKEWVVCHHLAYTVKVIDDLTVKYKRIIWVD